MRALALDMGGTHIGCGVVNEDRLLANTSIDAEGASSLADLLPVVTDALRALLLEANTTAKECVGVAIGFPGIVDACHGTIHSTLKKYEDAPKLDLAAWAREALDLPLRIENDARMALMGEQYAGAGRGVENIVMMTLGTGIGTAAILNGRVVRGVHGHAGCLGGHLTVKFEGRPCHCGNVGCAEAEASGWSMPQVARAWPGFPESALAKLEPLGFRELFTHAERGDTVACDVRERCLRVWAANAVSLVHAYDPDLVILGGGVMQSPEPVLTFVREYINTHTWSSWGKPQVQAAALGNMAALLGAVPLLTEEMHGASIKLQ
ncbi:ROK family protein [Edaphobacter bradus]|uniref:ROK family protein n=1 Tax=Edaphobacter bradus TaxID=2259016 RepID=UPI0021DF53CE|nr:ROK family protein [Edaphobacter bradus]